MNEPPTSHAGGRYFDALHHGQVQVRSIALTQLTESSPISMTLRDEQTKQNETTTNRKHNQQQGSLKLEYKVQYSLDKRIDSNHQQNVQPSAVMIKKQNQSRENQKQNMDQPVSDPIVNNSKCQVGNSSSSRECSTQISLSSIAGAYIMPLMSRLMSPLLSGPDYISQDSNGSKLNHTFNEVENSNSPENNSSAETSHLGRQNNNNYRYNHIQAGSQMTHCLAHHWLALLSIIVIGIYLIYYWLFISKKPKLIGQKDSNFVQYVRKHLASNIDRRFNPLLYFHGTNAQTALFGFLQGRTSLNKTQRTQLIRRQLLYISDVQYLNSNKDLSCHYDGSQNVVNQLMNDKMKVKLKPWSGNEIELENGSHEYHNDNCLYKSYHRNISQQQKNIRLALADMIVMEHEYTKESCKIQDNQIQCCSSCCYCSDLNLANLNSSASSDSGLSGGSSTNQSQATNSSRSSTSSLDSPMTVTSSDKIGNISMISDTLNRSDLLIKKKKTKNIIEKQSMSNQKKSLQDISPESSQFELDTVRKQCQDVKSCHEQQFGQCALDWFVNGHENYHKNKTIALISAGMTSGSDRRYVTDSVATLEKLGYECCVFIRRGVGGLKLSSAKFFSPAKWRDFEAAVRSIRRQRPGVKLLAVGFSFGSIELCRYLTELGPKSEIDAALLISCPFDPVCGGENMHNGSFLNRLIDSYLAKSLGKQLHKAIFSTEPDEPNLAQLETRNHIGDGKNSSKMKAKFSKNFKPRKASVQMWTNDNGSSIDLAVLPKMKSLCDFEARYNRVVQNYPSREAYAQDCELDLSRISVPTLCLSSEDDFMAPIHLLPLDQIEANKNLCMLLTASGGHMGFIDGLLWPRKPYFAQRIIGDYARALRNTFIMQKLVENDIQGTSVSVDIVPKKQTNTSIETMKWVATS